jgi:hypothetical protein
VGPQGSGSSGGGGRRGGGWASLPSMLADLMRADNEGLYVPEDFGEWEAALAAALARAGAVVLAKASSDGGGGGSSGSSGGGMTREAMGGRVAEGRRAADRPTSSGGGRAIRSGGEDGMSGGASARAHDGGGGEKGPSWKAAEAPKQPPSAEEGADWPTTEAATSVATTAAASTRNRGSSLAKGSGGRDAVAGCGLAVSTSLAPVAHAAGHDAAAPAQQPPRLRRGLKWYLVMARRALLIKGLLVLVAATANSLGGL